MKKKILITSFIVVPVAVAGFFLLGNSKNAKENDLPKVKVQRGTIVDKALAVGTIEPENEISVKSKVSGVVSRIFADAGTFVYAVVKERTREIGIKMAVGARKSYILFQFVFEALLRAFIGGAIGLLFSVAVVSIVGMLPTEDGPMQFLGRPVLSMTTMMLTMAILGLIGLLAGYFPARRAAGVDPVESLRYE